MKKKRRQKRYKKWILNMIEEIWNKFETKFINLWSQFPNGDAYPIKIFNKT